MYETVGLRDEIERRGGTISWDGNTGIATATLNGVTKEYNIKDSLVVNRRIRLTPQQFKNDFNINKAKNSNEVNGSTQGTGNVVLGSASYNLAIQKIADSKGAREGFNQIMADVDRYGNQLDDFSSDNVANFNSLVASLVVQIGDVDQEMHFARNKLNRAPKTLTEMIIINAALPKDKQWKLLGPTAAAFHMNGENGVYNLKFVSADEHFEAVYNKAGELLTADNDPDNMGTYNYFGPNDAKNHVKYDVDPYYKWGNALSQGINRSKEWGTTVELTRAASNLNDFYKNCEAIVNYIFYNELVNSTKK